MGNVRHRDAGRSARKRFARQARAWRRHFWALWIAIAAVAVICVVVGVQAQGDAKFLFGMGAGAATAMFFSFWDSPPWHIEKWRMGALGERMTARELRGLRRDGWRIHHDLARRRGNFDHIVVGANGVFLLDSKCYSGEARLEGDRLVMQPLEHQEGTWTCDPSPQIRQASAELKEMLSSAGVRWVVGVVVLWSRFPERVAVRDNVTFVHGSALTEWLRAYKGSRTIDIDSVDAALSQIGSAAT